MSEKPVKFGAEFFLLAGKPLRRLKAQALAESFRQGRLLQTGQLYVFQVIPCGVPRL